MNLQQEAETKLIGLLIQFRDSFLEVTDKIQARDFKNPVYGATFTELKAMYSEKKDPVEVSELMDRVSKQTGKSCHVAILHAVEEAVTRQSLPWAVDKFIASSKKRRLQQALDQTQKRIEQIDDVRPVLSELLVIATEAQGVAGKVFSGKEMVENFILRQQARRSSGDSIEGYRTGFETIDSHLGGLKTGRTGILSGAPGMGKTALAINWISSVAVQAQVPTLFASLEMDIEDVEDRLLGILASTSVKYIGTGVTTQTIYDGVNLIQKAPLFVSDNSPRDIADLSFLIEKHSRVHGIKLFILDYIGEMQRDKVRFKEERDERFSRWAKAIRDLAKRFDFHALILGQVNFLGQLAESKKMAAHADYYLHLDQEGGQRYLEMRKNRFGPSWCKYALRYDLQTQKMTEDGLISDKEGE